MYYKNLYSLYFVHDGATPLCVELSEVSHGQVIGRRGSIEIDLSPMNILIKDKVHATKQRTLGNLGATTNISDN